MAAHPSGGDPVECAEPEPSRPRPAGRPRPALSLSIPALTLGNRPSDSPPAATEQQARRVSCFGALARQEGAVSLARCGADPHSLTALCLQNRREKLALYDAQCSCIADGLYLGSDTVARSREALQAAGITHVLNATAYASPAYFRATPVGGPAADGGAALQYRCLWLQDSPGEDLLCVLYDACDFLDSVRAAGGRVLVHCSQGVSRSAALCIAYVMHTQGASFDAAFGLVKRIRGVASPNMGFACQLLQWAKRRGSPPEGTRLYRLQPHSPADPRYLVARQASPSGEGGGSSGGGALGMAALLDRRGAFVVHARGAMYVWHGDACPPAFLEAATRFAGQLARYEGAPSPAALVHGGAEPQALLDALGVDVAAAGLPPGAGLPAALHCAAYDDDFAAFAAGRRCDAALRGGVGAQEALQELSPRLMSSLALGTDWPPQPGGGVSPHDGASAGYDGQRPRSARQSMPALHWRSGPPSHEAAASPRVPHVVGAGRAALLHEWDDGEVQQGRASLWEFPSMEQLQMFDSDDLQSGRAFLLLPPGTPHAHVWLGRDFVARLAPGDTAQSIALRVATMLRAAGVPVPGEAPVIQLEGAETEDFMRHIE